MTAKVIPMKPTKPASPAVSDILQTLCDYKDWSKAASDSGLVTPIQFLAIVLWALESLKGSAFTEKEQAVVLAAWWEKLINATARRCATLGGMASFRHVVPFDALTLLELTDNKASTLDGWCMDLSGVDEWLVSLGCGAWCNYFLVSCGWRDAAGAQPSETAKQADKDSELLALLDAYEKRGKKTLKQFAPEHGLHEKNAQKRLIAARKVRKLRTQSALNPFASLQVVDGKKVAKK